MPAQRLSKKKYVSTVVQGKQSFIVFRKPTWMEAQEFLGELRGAVQGRKSERSPQALDKLADRLWEVAEEKFVNWNWVDEDGNKLPPLNELLPDDLLADEVDFVFDCLRDLYMLSDTTQGKSIA